ncbi:MAG: DUF6463 family protein [Sideroxydans sp.]|nr:DUF6463 family protein [Sideroxydans sp.]
MKHWKGRWLMIISAIHMGVAVALFGDTLASIIKRGVFDTVGNDPMTGAVVWFVLFGAMLFICGLILSELEKSCSGSLPRSIGWSLLVLMLVGVTLMPVSGFWLVLPPVISILREKPETTIDASET